MASYYLLKVPDSLYIIVPFMYWSGNYNLELKISAQQWHRIRNFTESYFETSVFSVQHGQTRHLQLKAQNGCLEKVEKAGVCHKEIICQKSISQMTFKKYTNCKIGKVYFYFPTNYFYNGFKSGSF